MHGLSKFQAKCMPPLVCLQAQEIIQIKRVRPADDSRSRDATLRQAPSTKSLSQAPQPNKAPAQLPECARPPIDWSLKTRALFHSQQPFGVCRDAIMAPSDAGASRAHAFSLEMKPISRQT